MIQEDIIRMALEAGAIKGAIARLIFIDEGCLERFFQAAYAAGAAAEREACAKVIEDDCHDDMTRAEEAAAIRAREKVK